MRVATFNVENLGSERHDEIALGRRIAVLRPVLERLSADILCLQELDALRSAGDRERRLSGLEALLEGLPCAAFHRCVSVHPRTGRLADKHNLAILSRWPIEAHVQHWHDLVSPPRYTPAAGRATGDSDEVRWERPALHAAIRLPEGRALHVVNVHLRAPLAAALSGQKRGPFAWKSVPAWADGFFIAAMKRSGQAVEVRAAIDRIFAGEPDPLIVCAGDFNAEDDEVPVRIVQASADDTGNPDLAPRSLVSLEHSLPAARRFSLIHGGRRLMLDHMLVSRPLLQHHRAFEAHNEALTDELADGKEASGPGSHHAALVAEFALSSAQPGRVLAPEK